MKRLKREKYVERLELDMQIANQVARETIGRNMKVQKRYHDSAPDMTALLSLEFVQDW